MIEHGAAVDIADAGGTSPLDAALATVNGEATKGSEAVAELLRKALRIVPPLSDRSRSV